MHVKVVTLEYDERLRGFPQEALDRALASGDVLDVRDHFFVHRGVPHVALVLTLAAAPQDGWGKRRGEPDPGDALPEPLRPVYATLRRWRNEQAKADGVPAYALFRNYQLAEICRRMPRTLAALREIDGVGQETCRRYGETVLAVLPPDVAPDLSAETPK